jgi:hypothetical protein
MPDTVVSITLAQIAAQIGHGVSNLGFRVTLQPGGSILGLDDFHLAVSQKPDGEIIIRGEHELAQITWHFQPLQDGFWVTLELAGDVDLACSTLESFSCDYRPANGSVDEWQIPTLGPGVESVGLFRVKELNGQTSRGSLFRGAFPNSRNPGIFLATRLPQKHKHFYNVEQKTPDSLHFSAVTQYLPSTGKGRNIVSETTWVSAHFNLRTALDVYGTHLPRQENLQIPVGWSSWDYYFFSVTLADVIENMEALRSDPQLAEAVKYIVVDDGWQHLNGEWQPNYKFPGGLERLADEIRQRGFIPGIWTAPILVHANSTTALRHFDMLIKNEHGDPLPADVPGHYLLDPTHPGGREFLVELYTRLYRAGFRFFKADFVSSLLDGQHFYDASKGPYEVIAELFHIIRQCITPDSHLMGCSLPEECGPGLADSHRTGIDIHNQWTHVEWAVQSLQLAGWQHDLLGINDPDFLIVRGQDTSTEAETNVLNPEAHNPNPPRWRRGPVFTLDEARTWGTLVSLSGGSVFLGDRITRLNDSGRDLLHRLVRPTGVPALPLDLGDDRLPSLWLADLGDEIRLGLINWSDTTREIAFRFTDYQINPPATVRDFWSGDLLPIEQDTLIVRLPTHGSRYVAWEKIRSQESSS